MLHISLVAEPVATVVGIPVTNAMLTTWVAMAAIVTFAVTSTRRLTLIPSKIQLVAELLVGGLRSLFASVMGNQVNRFFPVLATFFIFILFLNWVGLTPGVGTIGFHTLEGGKVGFVPLFRAGTADLNTTLALALVAIVVIQWSGFASLGISYLKKFINVTSPINFFVGMLELVSEVSKIISFAFRLFGNIFAGEVLLTVIAFLIPIIAPIPFLGLELFVGVIQALVFSMLTSVFLLLATTGHGEHAKQAR
ncbi:F0F1 ATP synthase subunit A [Candidatus Gottesmanbacteria bacterium]|nr:F0F1 ATP synthase subunit A [Candidatus Gottesmanbacteria bacterium]